MATVKVWTTIDRALKRDLRSLTTDLRFNSESECMREALRQGLQILKAQRSVFAMLTKKKDSILRIAGLLAEEYERLGKGELELKIGSHWKKAVSVA